MMNPALDIPNLLYRYADLLDAGDFNGAARLFDGGAILAGDHRLQGEEAIVAFWRGMVRLYADGTPRTRHLITNPTIHLSKDGQTAECGSQWTVLQATEGFPLQAVASGRYHDRLVLSGDDWRFSERRYVQIDLTGDMSAHLLSPLASEEN